jgi:hypothetical protein
MHGRRPPRLGPPVHASRLREGLNGPAALPPLLRQLHQRNEIHFRYEGLWCIRWFSAFEGFDKSFVFTLFDSCFSRLISICVVAALSLLDLTSVASYYCPGLIPCSRERSMGNKHPLPVPLPQFLIDPQLSSGDCSPSFIQPDLSWSRPFPGRKPPFGARSRGWF